MAAPDPSECNPTLDPLTAFITKVVSTVPPSDTTYYSNLRYTPEGLVAPTPAGRARIAYRNSLDEDSCLSFDEWKACGYFIKKGAKSQFTDALGLPQFTKEQVEKSKWRRPRY